MPADAPDPHSTPRLELWSVAFGRVSLVIGDPRGALINDRADGTVRMPTRTVRAATGSTPRPTDARGVA